MPTYDGIDYPFELDDIFSDRIIGPMFRAFCKKKLAAYIFLFYDALQKKNPKKDYKTFFAEDAVEQLNITGVTLAAAQKLGDAQDWKSKEWRQIYHSAKKEYERAAIDAVESFYKSKPFKVHHAFSLKGVIAQKVPKQLLEDLNVRDKNAVAGVAALLKADKRAGEKAVKIFAKKNKKGPSFSDVRALFKKHLKI